VRSPLTVSVWRLQKVKDVLVVTMDREDAALLKTPVMKERETVMVQEMVQMMAIRVVKVILFVAATTASNLVITIMRRTIAVNSLT